MVNRLMAVVGLDYPKPEHLARVHEAGGVSKLSDEERSVIMKRVEPGDYCDDIPEQSLGHLIVSKKVKVMMEEADERDLPCSEDAIEFEGEWNPEIAIEEEEGDGG